MRCVAGLVAMLVAEAASGAARVTPVEKVISLLEDLKAEVEDEGKKEATLYDTFACFCQSMTEEKSKSIKTAMDNVDEYTASIEAESLISKNKGREVEEKSQEIESIHKSIKEAEAMRETEKEKYETNAADLSKGITELEGAVTDLKAGLGGASFVKLKTSVKRRLLMASLLGKFSKAQQSALTAFLQDGPPPANEGSQDILSTMNDLEKDFKDHKAQVEQIEGQNAADFKSTMTALDDQLVAAEAAKDAAQEEKDVADGKVAADSEALTEEKAKLSDDNAYLHDLTHNCELKAREFDQHSKTRAGEITALGQAIDIITNKVKDNADDAKRAALVTQHAEVVQAQALSEESRAVSEADTDEQEVDEIMSAEGLVLLQGQGPARVKLAGLLQRSRSAEASAEARSARLDRVATALGEAGRQLHSPMLTAFALKLRTKLGADPFAKVKSLVQDLIQRLVDEATAEATKKGFCDTEMAKSTKARDANMEEVQRLNSGIEGLEATKARLENEISDLTSEIAGLEDALDKATKLRASEKAENEDTVAKAKAGLEAVKDAHALLTDFYAKAKKGSAALLQARASPVDEDAPEAPKGGDYKGNQDKAGGIVAMLDVIISDFERTMRVTEASENDAQREFVEFERTSKTSVISKTTSKSQAEASLKAADNQITEDHGLLEARMKMLDDTLKEIEDLKPTCVDTGMSFEERTQKREEEIAALKKAMCMLDGEGVEPDCA